MGSTVTDEGARQQAPGEHPKPRKPRQMQFEVLVIEGAEAEQLRLEQARVIREVVEWVARRQSGNGQHCVDQFPGEEAPRRP